MVVYGGNADRRMLHLEICQMVPISPATLFSGSVSGIDIYAAADEFSEPILFCGKNEPVESRKLREIMDAGVLKLFVSTESFQLYQSYLQDHWQQIFDDKKLSTATRTTVLSEVMRNILQKSFQSGNSEVIVNSSRMLGAGIVKILNEEKVLVSRLCNVLHHDYATFTHSTNVACYAALLAKGLGYSIQEQNEIVIGALLHDLGKLSVDERILRKAGRLDEFEFRAVQKHPLIGYRQLADREDLNHSQLMMVYQHHEKLNGKGYPVGLVGEEIHPWARLCAVVDVYEALTSARPYRSTMEQKVALSILQKAAETELDAEFVKVWSELVLDWRSL